MKVLLVEDDRKIATAVRRGLQAEGFTVEIALDGLEGRWRAIEGGYDLVILDLMLPGRNGFQVCADLRSAGVWTPILVLTAKDGEFDEAEALDTGADDFLSKPFSFPVLVGRVRALLRRAPGGAPAPMTLGDLRIEPAARPVWRGDTEVHLTSREFDVFEFLLRGPGRSTPSARFWPACGSSTTTATPTSSRSTSAAYGSSSTSRSAPTRSPRYTAPDTGLTCHEPRPDDAALSRPSHHGSHGGDRHRPRRRRVGD